MATINLPLDADIEKALPGRLSCAAAPELEAVRGSQRRSVLSQPALATRPRLGNHSMHLTAALWDPKRVDWVVETSMRFTAWSRPPLNTEASVSKVASRTGAP